MKQKMLKLIKILNKFTTDDILTMGEFEETQAKIILKEFEELKYIKLIAPNEFVYIPVPTNTINDDLPVSNKVYERKQKNEIKPIVNTLFTKAGEQQVFDNAPKYAKRSLIKYYTVLKLAGSFKGNNLETFLKQLSEQHPEYKMSVSTFHRIKQKYYKGGLKELIPRYAEGGKSSITDDMYIAFKNMYLKPSHYSLKECVNRLKLQFNEDLIPSYMCFKRRIYKDFSPEVIDKMRSMSEALPDLNLIEDIANKKIDNNRKYEYFIDAAREFISNMQAEKGKEAASRKSAINNHLIPFFKNYKFSEINQTLICNFQNKKMSEGYSIGSIKRYLGTLSCIYYKHSDCIKDLRFSSHNNLILATENPVLSDAEIINIIKNKSAELWILCLGITPAELAGIEGTDINYENKTINISKVFYNGGLQKHRKNYKIRTLKLHPLIYNSLNNNYNGRIMPNVDINNFDVLLNTHVKLLLEQNVPLNIIYKNLGYQCLNDFENRFNFLLPNSIKENFNILQNYL